MRENWCVNEFCRTRILRKQTCFKKENSTDRKRGRLDWLVGSISSCVSKARVRLPKSQNIIIFLFSKDFLAKGGTDLAMLSQHAHVY